MKKNLLKINLEKLKNEPHVVREIGPRYGSDKRRKTIVKNKEKSFSTISLFSGCGGLDLGFTGGFDFLNKKYSNRNFDIIWANDIDEPSCQTFANYFKQDIVCGDITQILSGKFAASLFEQPLPRKADVVLGGFPCQDFSHAGKRRGFNSKRGVLYQSMMEVIKRTEPVIFLAENVRGLLTINDGKAIEIIKKDFSSLGYDVVHELLLAANYGVPQMRQRVIIVGTKKGILPPFKTNQISNYPKQTNNKNNWVTLKQAIGDIEEVEEGSIPNHYWSKAKKNKGQGNSLVSSDKPGPTMRTEHHGNIEWHWNGKRRLSAREAARIQSFPDDFVFYPSTSEAYKQIGNAVPPVMAWHIATAVEKFLNKNIN